MTWYVALPLVTAAISAGSAVWFWQFPAGATPDWFGIGLLVGLTFVGVVQSLYRKMLEDQDKDIEAIWRLFR